MSTTVLPPPVLGDRRPSPPPASSDPQARRSALTRFVVGREEEARWVRPALLGLLAATAVLYLWGLGASGWANSFYSAAAQAGTKSWKAFFFGASDAAASITVDKPPASLWIMALSARIFGAELVEHPRAPGAGGRGRGGLPLRHGPALVHARGRPAGRRRAGAHPDLRAHVPLQQPRRAARAAADRRRVRHGPGARGRVDPLAPPGLHPGRLRLPDEDAPGPAGGPGLRARLPDRRSDAAAAPAGPADRSRRRAAGVGRLVGRHRRADPGVGPPLHRRLAGQQPAQPDLRLQRPRPADRQRGRQRRRRRRAGRGTLGPDRMDPHVQRRVRRSGLVAAAGRADPAGRPAGADLAGRANGPHPRRAVLWGGWLLVTGRRVQPEPGDHPPVLHGRPGAGHRRPRRHRGRGPVAPPQRAGRPHRPRRRHRGHGGGGPRCCSVARRAGCPGCARWSSCSASERPSPWPSARS